MARIIVTLDGTVLQEVTHSGERTTIGRGPQNDVVIDDIAISAEHAVIVTNFNDALLEDLNSTNGTQVNGQPVKKHFLQADDIIELAQYRIRYVADAVSAESIDCSAVLRRDIVLGASGKGNRLAAISDARHVAAIKVQSGANAGKQISLTKALTTIGRPGLQVAVIAYRPLGYCITHVEGNAHPLVNGEAIGAAPYVLADGDVIELSGTRMTFTMMSV